MRLGCRASARASSQSDEQRAQREQDGHASAGDRSGRRRRAATVVFGRFDNGKERYLYAFSDGTPGWHVITPLITPVGQAVLVDRGFVPDALKAPSSRAQGEINDTVTITGLARTSEAQGLFIPDIEPAENRWYWRDLGGLLKSMFPAGSPNVAPFILEAERSNVPGGWPLGGQTKLDLPNNHLQYALTWFLLALCVVVIYVIYVRSRLFAA